jgi:hypothetical protein
MEERCQWPELAGSDGRAYAPKAGFRKKQDFVPDGVALHSIGRNRRAKSLTSGVNNGTIISVMASVQKLLEQMRREPANVGFSDLKKVCQAYFGKPRQDGSSHAIFKTPWPGDPRVNIQNTKGKAKPYQVRQVLQAIDKLEGKT